MGRFMVFGLVFIALVSPSYVDGNELCPNTIVKLFPCKSYLMGKGEISVPCCSGVQGLMKMAISDNELKLQHICECLKKEALAIGVVKERVEQLPQLCKINLSVPFGANVDCKILKASSSTRSFKLNNYKNTGIMSFRRQNPNENHSIPHKKPLVIIP
ncbi:non-specific lipid-transfer protein 1-like [Lycium barbarum]|uniref:non-specific lipid-transfer protein 1-like n=1 Tax=Lycium barbarum TaxID=112863 RepID=UPI00293ED302|nr:non-specific lipid-transfer protein 1-like [Lycium barbarum]